jgi:hypothetical protein
MPFPIPVLLPVPVPIPFPPFVFLFHSAEITKQVIGQDGTQRALASALWKCLCHLCSCQVSLRAPEWWRPL